MIWPFRAWLKARNNDPEVVRPDGEKVETGESLASAQPNPDDPRARRILFNAYWSSKGWKMPCEEPSREDLAYAINAGVMFPPETLTHEAAVQRITEAKSLVSMEAVTEGFLASLVSRQLRLRPALASYFAVQRFEFHQFRGHPNCTVCGQFKQWEHDFSATNFARLKWGAVPRFYMVDHAFTLERFAVEPRLPASDADWALLHDLLTVADSQPASARARDLERAWKPLLRSSRAERDMMIEILMECGVLVASRTTPADYDQIPTKSNWSDQAALWRGDDGINHEQVALLFPQV